MQRISIALSALISRKQYRLQAASSHQNWKTDHEIQSVLSSKDKSHIEYDLILDNYYHLSQWKHSTQDSRVIWQI